MSALSLDVSSFLPHPRRSGYTARHAESRPFERIATRARDEGLRIRHELLVRMLSEAATHPLFFWPDRANQVGSILANPRASQAERDEALTAATGMLRVWRRHQSGVGEVHLNVRLNNLTDDAVTAALDAVNLLTSLDDTAPGVSPDRQDAISALLDSGPNPSLGEGVYPLDEYDLEEIRLGHRPNPYRRNG